MLDVVHGKKMCYLVVKIMLLNGEREKEQVRYQVIYVCHTEFKLCIEH